MAEELKENEVGQVGAEGQVQKEPTRSEERQKDLADKLSEQGRKHNLEMEEAQKKIRESEDIARQKTFEADLLRESFKYPQAVNFETDIRSYVDKGLSVSEATKLVLVNNNQLSTAEDQNREGVASNSLGGSSINVNRGGKRDPSQMSQEEKRAELVKLEESGELKKTLSSINISGE